MGAICQVCGRDMVRSKGCGVTRVHIGGRVYDRIRVGAPGDFDEGSPEDTRCHDCYALFGHVHHWGCDAERCPACGRQLLSCDCEDVFVVGIAD